MSTASLFYSFRARLLAVLAALLVATLGVQFYLNRQAERRTARLIAEQEQALAASTALALESINTGRYLAEMEEDKGRPLTGRYAGRVINVLVVNDEGRVEDSLDPRYMPRTLDDGSAHYSHVSEVPLPKLVESGQEGEDIERFLRSTAVTSEPVAGEPRAFPILVGTSKGANYIVVVLGSASRLVGHSHWEDVEPLLPTLGVLLAAVLAASLLVWRFTRPISDLTEAARRVASGDYYVHVPAGDRRDEMGALAANFNEMAAGLRRTRELERQLQVAERTAALGRLASAIAHEIKNPLNYINLTLDYLRTSLAPANPQKREKVERLTAQLKTEVARINTRIKEFLTYARPSKLELRPLDPTAEVEDALRLVEMQAAESGVEVSVEREGDIPPVMGDAESLRSVFTNLMINALQAMESQEGGRVTVALSSEGGSVRVRISDTGKGIPPENIEKVFEPYFSTKETGTGLGLAIVKKAVEDHGGEIGAESRQGEGTTFTVTLPAAGGDGRGTAPR